mgnify:CR=1 FL=1
MAVGVKLSLADRAFFRRAHRTNAAIFMDQRLLCVECAEPCFFHMDGRRFLAGCLTSYHLFPLCCPFFREEHYMSRSFSSSFNIFFRRRTYRAALFSTSMEGRFPFRVVFFRLDQRPFFCRERIESSSFPREPSFFHRSTNFSIRCYKPVALLSGILRKFKISKFRLIAPFILSS